MFTYIIIKDFLIENRFRLVTTKFDDVSVEILFVITSSKAIILIVDQISINYADFVYTRNDTCMVETTFQSFSSSINADNSLCSSHST